MLRRGKILLNSTKDLFSYPHEKSKLITEARMVWLALEDLTKGPDPPSEDLQLLMGELKKLYEKVRLERHRRTGKQITEMWVMNSSQMLEVVHHLSLLEGILSEREIDSIWLKCVTSALGDTQNG